MKKNGTHRILGSIKESVLSAFKKSAQIQQDSAEIMACIDEPTDNQMSWSRILIRGWAIPPKKIKWIEINHDDKCIAKINVGNELRPDLTAAFPSILDAKHGGFATLIKLGFKQRKYKLEFSAISTKGKIELGEKIVINSPSIINHPPENISIALTSRCNI